MKYAIIPPMKLNVMGNSNHQALFLFTSMI